MGVIFLHFYFVSLALEEIPFQLCNTHQLHIPMSCNISEMLAIYSNTMHVLKHLDQNTASVHVINEYPCCRFNYCNSLVCGILPKYGGTKYFSTHYHQCTKYFSGYINYLFCYHNNTTYKE